MTNETLSIIRKAVKAKLDVIRRGALNIFWQFDRASERFYIAVGLTRNRGTDYEMIEPKFDRWLSPLDFGRLFAGAGHWVGGES